LNDFKFNAFSVKAQRGHMRTTLANMNKNASFSRTTRFPEDGVFIDMNHSVPLRLIRQLTAALDLSDRQTEKGRDTEKNQTRAYSNFEDAKVAFYTAVDGLLDLCGGRAVLNEGNVQLQPPSPPSNECLTSDFGCHFAYCLFACLSSHTYIFRALSWLPLHPLFNN
jgi:hypothetical protein